MRPNLLPVDDSRLRRALAALLPVLCLLGACAHDFVVENRETPVHVWLSAPELASQGSQVDALIYVGAHKAVEGTVRFPRGTPHLILPTLYMSPGKKTVSVVLQGGAINATREVEIEGESWIQVTIRGRRVEVRYSDEEPLTPAGTKFPVPLPGS